MTMLTGLELRNFKCFRRQPLEFAPLTVLAGLNGMGKSSVIQALLLLRQSFASLGSRRLQLQGDLVDLGTGSDVFFDLADEDELGFTTEVDHNYRSEYLFRYNRESNRLAAITNDQRRNGPTRRLERQPDGSWAVSEQYRHGPPPSLLMTTKFQYLSAERLGPRKTLPWSDDQASRRALGSQGEYVLAFLARHGGETLPVGDPRLSPNQASASTSIEGQVTAWLQETSPGSVLSIGELRDVDALSARFAYRRRGDVASKPFRATNVGFGLSYVLPVLTALIAARKGDLVIVENPEAHLHPRGQTKLGELSARAAKAGVQVIVETHSDHFLDGLRIAVREKLLEPAEVRIHYFARHGAEAAVISPVIKPDGSLTDWPTGFFDERDENLIRLLAPIG